MKKMSYKFYAFLNRMKFINRWSLMRSTRAENVAEHSHQVALIAHVLGLIEKVVFHNDIDENYLAVCALYHETAEVITGDLPTPIKYFNADIKKAYKSIENDAENRLLASLPKELIPYLSDCVQPRDENIKRLLKFADKLSAYIKCIEEVNVGNQEFSEALKSVKSSLIGANDRTVNYFIENFIDAFYMNLDELSK